MSDMADEEKPPITTEFIAGQASVMLNILSHLQADQRANHRENTQKIDTVLANIPLLQNDIGSHHRRLTGLEVYNATEVEPLVNARKKRKWVWLGGTGALGVVSSPAWLPKMIAALNAVFP